MSAAVGELLAGEGHGHPDLDFPEREREPRRHYPDDGVRLAVQRNISANHAGVGAKAAGPQGVTDDRDARTSAGRILGRAEGPAEDRVNAEHREEVACCAGRTDLFSGVPTPGQVVIRRSSAATLPSDCSRVQSE